MRELKVEDPEVDSRCISCDESADMKISRLVSNYGGYYYAEPNHYCLKCFNKTWYQTHNNPFWVRI